jgi:hypothetical protein
MLKIAVLAPIPNARVRQARRVNPGDRHSERHPRDRFLKLMNFGLSREKFSAIELHDTLQIMP